LVTQCHKEERTSRSHRTKNSSFKILSNFPVVSRKQLQFKRPPGNPKSNARNPSRTRRTPSRSRRVRIGQSLRSRTHRLNPIEADRKFQSGTALRGRTHPLDLIEADRLPRIAIKQDTVVIRSFF